ncbi:MAG: radical SAM protein [Bacteroidetes bacterium]|nr:radical SAM protein [Bacteroidota bacterium]
MKPILANYYVTNKCNASCDFCDIWEDFKSPFINLDDAEKNLTDLKKLGVKVIDFTGGEPLLHPNIDELLRMAKSKGFLTTITSNGLLYPKKAESIKGLIDLLHFSLDSPIKEEHDLHRGVKCFDFVFTSIELALSLGEKPDLHFTVRNENVHHLPEMLSLARKHGVILIINPLFSYGDRGGQLTPEVLDILESYINTPGTYLNPAFIDLRRNGGNDISDPVCKAVSTTVVISARNELLLPCYHFNNQKIQLNGDLFDQRHSQTVKAAESMQGKYNFCQGCTVNCYFEPSFTMSMNAYMVKALPSKVKYSFTKFISQKVKAKLGFGLKGKS